MENIQKASVKNSVNRYMETTLPRTLTPDLCFLVTDNTIKNTIQRNIIQCNKRAVFELVNLETVE